MPHAPKVEKHSLIPSVLQPPTFSRQIKLHDYHIDMDRLEWTYHWPRFLSPYMEQVSKFIDIAKVHAKKENKRGIYCPCADCKNEIVWENLMKVNEHLVTRGFMEKHVIWTHHGEHEEGRPVEKEYGPIVEDMDYTNGCAEDNIDLEELLHHAEPDMLVGLARGLENFDALKKAAKDVLYDESKGCDSDFSTLRSHSTWAVLLTMYNLPTWLCQKRKCVLLCILIQGLQQPGIDIDIFLEPLLEDMADLWHEGLKVWDEYLRQHFTVKAIIFITINNYHAMFSVSGQIKGKTGWVICLNGTYYRYLPGSNKLVYLRHRQFLSKGHKFRKMKAEFDGTEENDSPLKLTPGDKVCEAIEKIECVFGKGTKKKLKGTKRKKTSKGTKRKKPDGNLPPLFKKHSIFLKYLSYWKDLNEQVHGV
uniref:Transposon protein, putative, CACTA, En/Spm sub-class n=1 Tax=Oryza sativa subsp. japonica TaxID=39947 RepID=Q339Q4_ORYSJ|nr:transposon protein, putative, CACTA, En/Spm sub-class [Oryza sativa Japonica Group]